MYTVILLWHVSGCGPLSLNEINKNKLSLLCHRIAALLSVVVTVQVRYIGMVCQDASQYRRGDTGSHAAITTAVSTQLEYQCSTTTFQIAMSA